MKAIFKPHGAIVILFCTLLLASSCKVSLDAQQPDIALPETFRGAAAAATTPVDVLPWGDALKEEHLKQLIDTALVNNADLQLAVKNIDAASQLLTQSKLGYLPNVNLAVNATSSRPSDNSLNGISLNQFLGKRHIEDYTAGAGLSWEADIWGKVSSQKKEALAAYLLTGEAKKAVQTQLVANVARGYYNLLMLDAQLKIAKENEALNTNTLQIITLQYDSGQVTSLAVQQAEAQQLTASSLVPRFEQEIVLQENAISLLLGKMPAPVVRAASLDIFFPLESMGAGVPAQLLQRRPDVKQAELDIVRTMAVAQFTKANMYPSLTITAQGGVNSFTASNWFNLPASLFGNVMGGLTQPLFQRRKLKTQYELAKIEQEKAIVRFKQQLLIAVGEVSSALVKIDKLGSQRLETDKRTQTLQKATANADLLFKNGLATYLEVITAQSNVLQSELQSAEIKRAQLEASIELYRSVGGGWQ